MENKSLICRDFTSRQCIDGNCPDAMAEEAEWLDHVDCEECRLAQRKEGCTACIWSDVNGECALYPFL